MPGPRGAVRSLAGAVAVVVLLGACGTAPDDVPETRPATGPVPGPGAPALPPVDGTLDYQLGGPSETVDTGAGVVTPDVVVRDAGAAPLPGAYSVCYVNGFQTQPDAAALWADHEDLLLHDAAGEPVVDPDWPDEHVLDPSTAAQREGILAILGPVVTGCADDGFDAVEIDNLDTWTRFDTIDEDGAHALARAYVDLAHDAGLAVAQKNAAEIVGVARDDLGFDFAVTEECAVFDECAAYTDTYGDHVLQVEYPDALDDAGLTFDDVCARDDRAPLTVLRDRDLVTPDDPGYIYVTC